LDITSCTILTAEADKAIASIHHQMPIILKEKKCEEWLSPSTDVECASDLLKAHRGSELISYRVGRDVNSSRANGSELIDPI
jgi:putative SOS response-associated peptidase YedK